MAHGSQFLTLKENADLLIGEMSDINLPSKKELEKLQVLMLDMTKLSKLDELRKFIEKCQEVKTINHGFFSKYYKDILGDGLILSMEQGNKDCCNLLLASDLIDIHDMTRGYMWTASFDARIVGLSCLIEKDVSFTRINDKNENIFHSLGEGDFNREQPRSIKCLVYLLTENEKVKNDLIKTNYDLLFQKNDEGLDPIDIYLKKNHTECISSVINNISDLSVLNKIQKRINAHLSEYAFREDVIKVLSKLNEKIIKHEKETLNILLSNHSLSKATQTHKI